MNTMVRERKARALRRPNPASFGVSLALCLLLGLYSPSGLATELEQQPTPEEYDSRIAGYCQDFADLSSNVDELRDVRCESSDVRCNVKLQRRRNILIAKMRELKQAFVFRTRHSPLLSDCCLAAKELYLASDSNGAKVCHPKLPARQVLKSVASREIENRTEHVETTKCDEPTLLKLFNNPRITRVARLTEGSGDRTINATYITQRWDYILGNLGKSRSFGWFNFICEGLPFRNSQSPADACGDWGIEKAPPGRPTVFVGLDGGFNKPESIYHVEEFMSDGVLSIRPRGWKSDCQEGNCEDPEQTMFTTSQSPTVMCAKGKVIFYQTEYLHDPIAIEGAFESLEKKYGKPRAFGYSYAADSYLFGEEGKRQAILALRTKGLGYVMYIEPEVWQFYLRRLDEYEWKMHRDQPQTSQKLAH